MDTPPVQYASTSDGVSIAFRVLGELSAKPNIVYLPAIGSSAKHDFEIPAVRRWFDEIAGAGSIVIFDDRGRGLSGGQVANSPDEAAEDLLAVLDATGLERASIVATAHSVIASLRVAATHPERISRMVLYGPGFIGNWQGASMFADSDRQAVLRALMSADWELYTRVIIGLSEGWREDGYILQRARAWAEAVGPDYTAAMNRLSQGYEWQVDAQKVECPTLVVGRTGFHPQEMLRALTTGIPNATLAVFDGDYALSSAPTDPNITSTVARFLHTSESDETEVHHAGFQTILFTDLEASTPLTQRLGDEAAQELLRGHNASVRRALEEHGGREVKHTGDGIMASFPSAVSAVTAALQIQADLAGGEVRVRVGLNAGEPIAEDDDLFGLSVIKAARIADRAEPGQVLVSDVVRQLCEGKTFEFTSLAAVSLKGFDEPVTLFEVLDERGG